MSYFNNRQKYQQVERIQGKGIQSDMGQNALPVGDINRNTIKASESKGGGLDKGLAIAGAATSLLQKDTPDLDTTGNTDYGSLENEDVTGGIGKTASDTLGMASKGFAVGGPVGAIAGGILGLGKNLIGGAKAKKELAQAKERFQNKKRYQSAKAIDEIADSTKEQDIVSEENLAYVENLKNSPGYNRFKRNSQYTI